MTVDLVRVVDQRRAGGPVAFVEAPAHADKVPSATALTLQEWRALNTDAGAMPGVGGGGSQEGRTAAGLSAAAAGGEGRGPAGRPLPAPTESSSPGCTPGATTTTSP